MIDENEYKRYFLQHCHVNALPFLTRCFESAVHRLKNILMPHKKGFDASSDESGESHEDACIAAMVRKALLRDRRDDETSAFLAGPLKENIVPLLASRVSDVLRDEFGLAHGIAAPGVIVLDLCPMEMNASKSIIGEACSTLALKNVELSSEEGVNAFKNKFWTMDNSGFTLACDKAWIDLSEIYAEEVGYIQKFPNPAERYKKTDAYHFYSTPERYHAPVLVVLGLFSEPLFLNEITGAHESPPAYVPSYRKKKPFTRHDESMLVFRFVEGLLMASGQGMAMVLAPSEISRAPEAAGTRKRWLKEFDRIYVDTTPRTAIYQLVKRPRCLRDAEDSGVVFYGIFDNEHAYSSLQWKYKPRLLESSRSRYLTAFPTAVNRYSFIPPPMSMEYHSWMPIADISKKPPINGLMEKRGGALIDIDGEMLARRMRAYLDPGIAWSQYKTLERGLTERLANFNPEEARERILKQITYNPENIRPYSFKPFDTRKCYYSTAAKLWNDPRVELFRHCRPGARYIVTRPAAAVDDEGAPFFLTSNLTDGDLMRGHAYCFPFLLYDEDDGPRPNLSQSILDYLSFLGTFDDYDSRYVSNLIWHHVLAVGFSPAYLMANNTALQHDWPRIPLPIPSKNLDAEAATALLRRSAELGELVEALLDPEIPFPPPEIAENVMPYSKVAALSNGEQIRSIALAGKWGYEIIRNRNSGDERGKNIVSGPGRLLMRDYTNEERFVFENLGADMGLHAGVIYAALGVETYDIFINQDVYWRNIPSKVWKYRIGGYPILKKWLSYREHAVLGRELRRDEIAYFSQMAHRLVTLRLIESRLDTNFARIRDHGGTPRG